MSTISSTVTVTGGVTVGSSAYPSPLTITSQGTVISPSGFALTSVNTPVTVFNAGYLDAVNPSGPLYGVVLAASSYLNNSGTIKDSSTYGGIEISGGTVVNSGAILNSSYASRYGVALKSSTGGSYLKNLAGGYITEGVDIDGRLVNYGTIVDANGNGVASTSTYTVADTVINTGIISGSGPGPTYGFGIILRAGGTVFDSGTISGTNGTAIAFGGSGANLLQLAPGYALSGNVVGSSTAGATNTMELTSAASQGTISGIGSTKFSNFGSITVDAGAQWTLNGSNTIGSGVRLSDFGSLANTGSLDGAVTLTNGGYLDNSGTIDGGNQTAVYGTAGPNTVTNSGTIAASGTSGIGIDLLQGGSVANLGSAALISSYLAGISVTGASGTVTNSGIITSAYRDGVVLNDGGSVGNLAGGYIQGHVGVYVLAAAGSVTNAGTIVSILHDGVDLTAGGSGANYAGGLIKGYNGIGYNGLYTLGSGSGTVTNSGTIIGYGNAGITLYGGSVGNDAGGLIQGYRAGVYIGTAATVMNSGTIAGTAGVAIGLLSGGGYVGNAAGGLIQGDKYGVYVRSLNGVVTTGTVTNAGTIVGLSGVALFGGGTVFDSGTISGTGGFAIGFGGTSGGNLLILEQGYQLNGAVQGSVSASNTVELVGSVGAAVTVGYNGLGLSNFQDVLFGPDGNATLQVTNVTGTVGIVLSGFTASTDVLDLTALGAPIGYGVGGGQVTVSGANGTVAFNLDASDATHFTLQSDGASGTELIACFARGTLIETPDGEVPVEGLKIGDPVVTLSGAAKPIRWIGRRAYDGRFIAGKSGVLPIRIAVDALADGVPARDLYLSPEHSLYIDAVLVQAKHLVNGATIVQQERVERVEYFHIELAGHDIIFADGAATETFVDCDNRNMFANADEYAALYPEDARPAWEFCAERLGWEDGDLTRIRARLIDRAEALGHALDPDPDLHLVVDGTAIRPDSVAGGRYRFTLPASGGAVVLASRHAVPAESLPESRDIRRLGVPVERILMYDEDLSLEAWHGHALFADGFHADEATHRWTDGMALLPEPWLRSFAGALTIEVHLAPSALAYRLSPVLDEAAAA